MSPRQKTLNQELGELTVTHIQNRTGQLAVMAMHNLDLAELAMEAGNLDLAESLRYSAGGFIQDLEDIDLG